MGQGRDLRERLADETGSRALTRTSGTWSGLINLQDSRSQDRVDGQTDVLNGIAYDATGDRLFVTGKKWPKLFEIRLVKKASR